jgi:hypothetical protein
MSNSDYKMAKGKPTNYRAVEWGIPFPPYPLQPPVMDRGPLATYHSSMAPPSAIVAKDDTSTMFKLGAFDGSSPRSLVLQGLGLVVVAAVLWWYAYP